MQTRKTVLHAPDSATKAGAEMQGAKRSQAAADESLRRSRKIFVRMPRVRYVAVPVVDAQNISAKSTFANTLRQRTMFCATSLI